MEYLDDLILELNSVGKIDKFKIYSEIVTKCYSKRDKIIFKYFNDFLNLLDEYLDFDPKPNEDLKEIISLIFKTVFRFIRNSNNLKQFENYFPIYKKYRELIIDEVAKAHLFQYFGYFYWLKQNHDESIKYLSDSLDLITKSGQLDEIPGRYTNLGFIFETKGEFDKAEYYYNEGLDFAKENNLQNSLQLAYNALGRLNFEKKLYKRAIPYFENGLALFDSRESTDKVSLICNLASCYLQLKEYSKSLSIFKKINKKWLIEQNPPLYYSILGTLSVAYINLKEYDKAEKNILQTISFFEENDIRAELSMNYINLGNIYFQQDKLSDSLQAYKKAQNISAETNNITDKLMSLIGIGKIYMKQEFYKKAITQFKQALGLTKKIKRESFYLMILKYLSECYEYIENYKEAIITLKKYNLANIEYLTENQKKEKEISANPLIGIDNSKQYLFKENTSLISKELTTKIGVPILGRSSEFLDVINKAILAGGNNECSVLIRGESGTGKELIARLIHFSSLRANYPFVAINSASFTQGIAQSALFGHKKGSFTGATHNQIGHLEAANKGTIFFDEIGDMPLNIQAKLLRTLESKTIQPIGSGNEIKIDFRLISATNIDLFEQVKNNNFRLDFYNRINTLEIKIPPLRKRREDIPILIDYYLNRISNKLNRKKPKIRPKALRKLYEYDYRGNIRELKNIVERLVLFSQNNIIREEDLFLPEIKSIDKKDSFKTLNLEENEKTLILEALKRSKNIKIKAAELLGISNYTLLRRMKKYRL